MLPKHLFEIFGLLTLIQSIELLQPITVNTYGCNTADDEYVANLEKRLVTLEKRLLMFSDVVPGDSSDETSITNLPRDCSDIGNKSDGVYHLRPKGAKTDIKAYCMWDEDGAWTVFQRRRDGSVDFQRCWSEYKNGFGILTSNYWLGNEAIHLITSQRQYTLRVDITDWDNDTHYAEYSFFEMDGESRLYSIHYMNYTGTARDSLGDYHLNVPFSTFDRENDLSDNEHCALLHGGGWWYRDCDHANLNGQYQTVPYMKGNTDFGIEWDKLRVKYSFKATTMRIKPAFPN